MVSKHGLPLLSGTRPRARELLPPRRAGNPNIPEAEARGMSIRTLEDAPGGSTHPRTQASCAHQRRPSETDATDLLYDGADDSRAYRQPTLMGPMHVFRGDVAGLAVGPAAGESAARAKRFIHEGSAPIRLWAAGRGPVNHHARLSRNSILLIAPSAA
jgi:hypothetical protein